MGEGSGTGQTATRGQKGQRSRSGDGKLVGFEGGQTPLLRRIPKRGFTNGAFKVDLSGRQPGVPRARLQEQDRDRPRGPAHPRPGQGPQARQDPRRRRAQAQALGLRARVLGQRQGQDREGRRQGRGRRRLKMAGIADIFEVPDLRRRIGYTLGALAIFRVGASIPIPGVNADAIKAIFNAQSGNLLGFLNIVLGRRARPLLDLLDGRDALHQRLDHHQPSAGRARVPDARPPRQGRRAGPPQAQQLHALPDPFPRGLPVLRPHARDHQDAGAGQHPRRVRIPTAGFYWSRS